jgi:hypothetical protein
MKTTAEKVKASAELARQVDGCGNAERRNAIARHIFANPKRRKVTWYGESVETWYDPQTRSYVTQRKDSEGNQIGDAEYAGNRDSAAFAHLCALWKLFGIGPKTLRLTGVMREIQFDPATGESSPDDAGE